jgi:hypothetical protein
MRKLDRALDFATLTGALVFGLVKLILWLPPITYIDIITGFAVLSMATLVFATLSMLLHQPTRRWIEEENERLREMAAAQKRADDLASRLHVPTWEGGIRLIEAHLTITPNQTSYYGAKPEPTYDPIRLIEWVPK